MLLLAYNKNGVRKSIRSSRCKYYVILPHQKPTLLFYHIILQYLIYQMFYSLILKIKIIYLPKTQQIYKCIASGSRHHPRTNNHRHKLQPQSPDPFTNSKSKNINQKKKKNSKSSTKPQPNRSINDQTQPTIGDESCG